MSNSEQVVLGQYNKIYKSDSFVFLHPSGEIKKNPDETYVAEIDDNVGKINKKYTHKFFDKDGREFSYKFPCDDEHLGGLMVFPYCEDHELVVKTKNDICAKLSKIVASLKDEYYDEDDFVEFNTVDSTGKYFGAEFVNINSGEKFNKDSIAIMFAGCSATTFTYLLETFLDKYLGRAAEKKVQKLFPKSFLVCDFNKHHFYELATKSNIIYTKEYVRYDTNISSSYREYSFQYTPDSNN